LHAPLEPVRSDDRVDQVEEEEHPEDASDNQLNTHALIIGTEAQVVNFEDAKLCRLPVKNALRFRLLVSGRLRRAFPDRLDGLVRVGGVQQGIGQVLADELPEIG